MFVYRKSKIFGKKIWGADYTQKVAKSPGLGIPPSSEEANKHVFGQLGVRSIRWRKKNFKKIFKIKNIETKTFFQKIQKQFKKKKICKIQQKMAKSGKKWPNPAKSG